MQRAILDSILGSPQFHNDEALYHCPKCNHHKRKLSVNLLKGVFKCWVCEFSGKNLAFLIKKYGSQEQYLKWASSSCQALALDEYPATKKEPLSFPDEFITLCTIPHTVTHRAALNYLRGRGLENIDLFRWKIGFCYGGRYRDRIIIPSFDILGNLDYFVARAYSGDKIKYLNPNSSKDIVFNELMINWSKPIVLVEGAFDAMKIANSIPLLGSTLRIDSKLFQSIIKEKPVIYIALDHDASHKEEKIIKNLLLYGLTVYKMIIPPNKDVGDLTKEECKVIQQKANFVDGTDYLLYQKIFSEAFK